MKNSLLTIIVVAVILSVVLSAWALIERSEMKTEIAVLNTQVETMQEEIKELKTKPAQAARPSAPTPSVVKGVRIDDDPIKGDKNAPITIVEFSDFECPFCKRSNDQVISKIDEEYVKDGKVRLVFRDFPLGFHKQAIPAAVAANCAGEQGKYWEVHDFLFKSRNNVNQAAVLNAADSLGLDKAKLKACMDDPSKVAEVNKDMEEGKKYGVRGTPSYFIGKTTDNGEIEGTFIRGAQPYNVFQEEIDKQLKTVN